MKQYKHYQSRHPVHYLKIYIILILTIVITLNSCKKTNSEQVFNTRSTNEITVGGLYLFREKDDQYYITKVLAIDNFAVHIRMYSNKFKNKPIDISSDSLKILVGHSPLDKNGFLLDKPELLKVESVSENELDGYKIYLEEMSK